MIAVKIIAYLAIMFGSCFLARAFPSYGWLCGWLGCATCFAIARAK